MRWRSLFSRARTIRNAGGHRRLAAVCGLRRDRRVVGVGCVSLFASADNEAQQLNQLSEQIAAEFGVPWRFVYATSNDIAETVLDIAATHAVDVLVLGATRRGALWKVMKGDVIQKVAELLPESINLLIHA
jgi:nucleotide-binding universal stress UspA family protein